jgi:hypothetical protein
MIKPNILKLAKIYGRNAIVYHGSKQAPDKFLEDLKSLNPRDGAFGRGLYTVAELGESKTLKGKYGDYLYKLKINLSGFISFLEEESEIIHGAPYSPKEQYKLVGGTSKKVYERLPDNFDFSSEDLKSITRFFLNGNVKGIVYHNYMDGLCVLPYDSELVTPLQWRYLDGEWNNFSDKQKLEFVNKNIYESFQKNKYEKDIFKGEGMSSFLLNLSSDAKIGYDNDILIKEYINSNLESFFNIYIMADKNFSFDLFDKPKCNKKNWIIPYAKYGLMIAKNTNPRIYLQFKDDICLSEDLNANESNITKEVSARKSALHYLFKKSKV